MGAVSSPPCQMVVSASFAVSIPAVGSSAARPPPPPPPPKSGLVRHRRACLHRAEPIRLVSARVSNHGNRKLAAR